MSDKKLTMPRELIAKYIQDKGMLQREFAESIGITPPQFSNYMKGIEPSEKTLRKIYMMYPEIEEKMKERESTLKVVVKSEAPAYYIEKAALDYIIKYNSEKHVVLKSNQPDQFGDVKITYSKIEHLT